MRSQIAELLARRFFPPRKCGQFLSDTTFMLHSIVDASKLVYGPRGMDLLLLDSQPWKHLAKVAVSIHRFRLGWSKCLSDSALAE